MKKLLSIAFIFTALILGVSTSAMAQTGKFKSGVKVKHHPNAGVKTYTETRTVRVGGKFYRETYQVKVFRNGKRTSRLISRVLINNRVFKPRPVQTYYQTGLLRENGRRYRVTYKITKYSNGQTQEQIIKKVRV